MDRKIVWQVLFLCFTVLFLVTRPLRLVRVEGSSMYPSLQDGQMLLGARFFHLQRGDVVVFRDDYGDEMIKRVKYMEGDTYIWSAITPKDYLYMDEEYLAFMKKIVPDIKYERYTIGKDRLWILGDNLGNSEDSRVFGAIEIGQVDYKIIAAL